MTANPTLTAADFSPGDRVLTPDGPGRVTRIRFVSASDELPISVRLDSGGGNYYAPDELTQILEPGAS